MTTYIVKPGENLNGAVAGAGAGDLVQVQAGNYGVITVNGRKLPAENPLVIKADPNVVIRGAAITGSTGFVLNGFGVTGKPPNARGSLYLTESEYILLQGCRVFGVPRESVAHAGIRIYRAHHNTVIGCEVDGSARGTEIQFSSDTWVEDCFNHDIMSVPGDSDAFVTYDGSLYTVFKSCVGARTMDDIFDTWTSRRTVFVNCTGYDAPFEDDGNVFKLGGGQEGCGDHIVLFCEGHGAVGCGVNTNNGWLGSLVGHCYMHHNNLGVAESSEVRVGSKIYSTRSDDNRRDWSLNGNGTVRDDDHVVTVADLPAWVFNEAPERVKNLLLATVGGGGPQPRNVVFDVADNGLDTLRVVFGAQEFALKGGVRD